MWRPFAVVIALFSLGADAQSQGYRNLDWVGYRNDRFGLTLSYPARVFQIDRVAEAGDGQLFISRDGRARLLVGAFENDENHSPATYQRFIARQSYRGYDIAYAPVGRGWSVLSGTRDGKIFYEKAIFSCSGGVINSFAIIYPAAHRHVYDAIVERIEDTFRAGSEGCS